MEGLYRIGLGILGYFHDRLLEMEFMDAWKLLTQQVNEVENSLLKKSVVFFNY